MRGENTTLLLLLIVAIMGFLATSLLVVAVVVWLSYYFGSVTIPCLCIAALMLLIAFIIYQVGLKARLREWAERVDTVYEVVSLLRSGYSLIKEFLFRT